MIIIKRCSICNESKELDEFYSDVRENKSKGKYTYFHPYCKECEKEKNAKWRKRNPEKRKESIKKDNARPEKKKQVLEANKEYRKNGGQRNWQHRNKNKLKGYQYDRSLHKVHEISIIEREMCKLYFNHTCAYCGISEQESIKVYSQKLHMDHADNLGVNDLSNAIPACRVCNSSKGTNNLEDWFMSKEFYSKERLYKIKKWLSEDYKLYIENKYKITI